MNRGGLLDQSGRAFGGLLPMEMFQAYRRGVPVSQIEGMNPRMQMRPQFLPPALAQQGYSPMMQQPTQFGATQGGLMQGYGSASDGISPPGAPDIGEPEGVIGGDGLGGASGGAGGK